MNNNVPIPPPLNISPPPISEAHYDFVRLRKHQMMIDGDQ